MKLLINFNALLSQKQTKELMTMFPEYKIPHEAGGAPSPE